MASLGGLLFAAGLGLELSAVAAAIRGCRLALILFVNFVVVPLLAFGVAWGFGLPAAARGGVVVDSLTGTKVVAAVVANGLLLIFLGL